MVTPIDMIRTKLMVVRLGVTKTQARVLVTQLRGTPVDVSRISWMVLRVGETAEL